MRKIAFISIILSLLLALSACVAGLTDRTPDSGHETSKNAAPVNDKTILNSDDVTYISLTGSIGGPPYAREDGGDTKFYFWAFSFYPDGQVEYVEKSYYQDELYIDHWQKDAENFTKLMRTLNEIGYFSLPERFPMDLPYDSSSSTLLVYTEDDCYYSSYVMANDGKTDEASYEVVITSQAAFRQLAKRPLAADDIRSLAMMLSTEEDINREIQFSSSGWVYYYERLADTNEAVKHDYWQVETDAFEEFVRFLLDAGVAGLPEQFSCTDNCGGIRLHISTERDSYVSASVQSGGVQDTGSHEVLESCRDALIRLTQTELD